MALKGQVMVRLNDETVELIGELGRFGETRGDVLYNGLVALLGEKRRAARAAAKAALEAAERAAERAAQAEPEREGGF
jgi:hypothetical protein